MNEPAPRPTPPAPGNDLGSPHQVHALAFLAVTAASIYLCYRLVAPFQAALAWALALAVLFAPLHRWLERKAGRPNLAATLTVCVIGVAAIGLTAFVAEQIVVEAARVATLVQARVESGEWVRALADHPQLVALGRWIEGRTNFAGATDAVASWLTSQGALFVRGSLVQVAGVLLTFYFLFYFLRDRGVALGSLRSMSPLTEGEMDELFLRVSHTVHATIYGTLVVGAVQGTLAGLMFWWLGLPAPLLWGVVMGLLAVVPVLGAFIIWIPAAVLLVLDGSWGKALILSLWGSVVVGGIDNLLYPMLVGNRLKLHTLVAFISLIGGLIVFGPSGLILGPVVVTVTLSLLEFWRGRNVGGAR